jgi:predicted RND superfamily exporter protein
MDIKQAVVESGKARFRPVLLTSVTTIAGLFPLLLERSFQAQFLIPMAVSICFGLLAATILTLLYVPALYLIVQDIINMFSRKKQKTEDRGQRAEGRSQMTEVRGQKTEGRGQRAEVRGQKTEDRGQKTED